VEGREDKPLAPKKKKKKKEAKSEAKIPEKQSLSAYEITLIMTEKVEWDFPVFDVQELKKQWEIWARKQVEHPRSADAAFLGWVKNNVKSGRLKPVGSLKKMTRENAIRPNISKELATCWRIFSEKHDLNLSDCCIWPSSDYFSVICSTEQFRVDLEIKYLTQIKQEFGINTKILFSDPLHFACAEQHLAQEK